MAPTQQRELDHADQGLSALKDLHHEVRIDDLAEVCNICSSGGDGSSSRSSGSSSSSSRSSTSSST